jgi:GT2 family glycosyltransferase
MSVGISVITPCLNGAATLETALESVRSQSEHVHEHIVVDGGSTDGSLDLLRDRPGVRWISEPDRGLSDAFNKGAAMATGDFIGWLNADDFYYPDAIALVAQAARRAPTADWVTGRCAVVDHSGAEIRSAISSYKDVLLRHYGYPLLLVNNFIAAPATFVRRETFLELGGLDERFRYSMDYDLWLRLGRLGPPAVVDERLAAFRMVDGSLSMSGFEDQFHEHAQNAREHGSEYPGPVLLNRAVSRGIVAVYRMMRASRAWRHRA